MIIHNRKQSRIWAAFSILTSLLVAGAVSPARADVIANGSCLPPPNSEYVGMFHQWNAPGGPYVLTNAIHAQFTNCTPPPSTVGGITMDSFSSLVSGNLSVNGNNMGLVSGTAQVGVNVTLASVNGGTSLFNTQMTQLDISNLGGNPNIKIRIDPTSPSLGQTTITNIGGGNFQIHSFFDIFTDLSLDGGLTWTASTASTRMSVNPTPEPASVLLLALGAAAFGARRRKT